MNTFVYCHSALLAHFPLEDTEKAEELRGTPRESPHNRDFEETVNLIVRHAVDQLVIGPILSIMFVLICYEYYESCKYLKPE